MIQTITKTERSLKILKKLIDNGFYRGYVNPEKFELLRNHFPNGYRIIGILNDNGKYEAKCDFEFPMNILARILLVFGILTSIFFLLKGNWIMSLIFLIIGLIIIICFALKKMKEIKLFTNKFLEFDKIEYD